MLYNELGRRLSTYKAEKQPNIRSAKHIAKLLIPELSQSKKEKLIGIYLDTRTKIIRKETIFIGTLNQSIIHPREIFKIALAESAAAIIIAHNHPSNDTTPSQDDRNIWKRLDETGNVVGIQVLDHIIITPKGDYFSGKENMVRKRKEN